MILASWGPLWRPLGGLLGRLGGLFGRLGALVGRLGGLLGPLGRFLGRLGGLMGRLGARVGRLGGLLGPSWPVFRPSWARKSPVARSSRARGGGRISGLGSLGGGYGGELSHTPRDPQGVGGFSSASTSWSSSSEPSKTCTVLLLQSFTRGSWIWASHAKHRAKCSRGCRSRDPALHNRGVSRAVRLSCAHT